MQQQVTARRDFLQQSFAALLALLCAPKTVAAAVAAPEGEMMSTKTFPYQLSEAEWRRKLTPEQYYVLREHGTERAGTCPLSTEKRAGAFYCAGCGNPLFNAERKFDSGTGWPSFNEPLPNAIGTSVDYKLVYPRTEVHCANCGSHLGHVFDDGPPPSGKRYCINGVALVFVPDAG